MGSDDNSQQSCQRSSARGELRTQTIWPRPVASVFSQMQRACVLWPEKPAEEKADPTSFGLAGLVRGWPSSKPSTREPMWREPGNLAAGGGRARVGATVRGGGPTVAVSLLRGPLQNALNMALFFVCSLGFPGKPNRLSPPKRTHRIVKAARLGHPCFDT